MLLQCQLQLFEENRWLAWELFWVASLWSGSTVTYLNWAASRVNCEMNWSVASQLNRAHSSQRGDHLARPSQSNREPIPSIPTLRNASEMCGYGPSGANCATPPLTASINLTTAHHLPYLPNQTIRCSLFCGKQLPRIPLSKKLIPGQTMLGQSSRPQVSAARSRDKIRIGSLRRPASPSFPCIWVHLPLGEHPSASL